MAIAYWNDHLANRDNVPVDLSFPNRHDVVRVSDESFEFPAFGFNITAKNGWSFLRIDGRRKQRELYFIDPSAGLVVSASDTTFLFFRTALLGEGEDFLRRLGVEDLDRFLSRELQKRRKKIKYFWKPWNGHYVLVSRPILLYSSPLSFSGRLDSPSRRARASCLLLSARGRDRCHDDVIRLLEIPFRQRHTLHWRRDTRDRKEPLLLKYRRWSLELRRSESRGQELPLRRHGSGRRRDLEIKDTTLD